MEILQLENIILNQSLLDQQAVFQKIAQLAVQNGYSEDAQAIVESMSQRELEGATGMMDGFAIPHGKSSVIRYPAIFVVKLASAIEWNSMDGKPIDVVVSLLIPEGEAGTTHLKLLSQVAKLLMKEEVKTQIKKATNESQLLEIIQENI